MEIQRRKGTINNFFQIEFYQPKQFENSDGHKEPKFYKRHAVNGSNKCCAVTFYLFCDFENVRL